MLNLQQVDFKVKNYGVEFTTFKYRKHSSLVDRIVYDVGLHSAEYTRYSVKFDIGLYGCNT